MNREQHEDQAAEQPAGSRVFRPPATLADARHLTTWQWYRLATEWPDDYARLVGCPRTHA